MTRVIVDGVAVDLPSDFAGTTGNGLVAGPGQTKSTIRRGNRWISILLGSASPLSIYANPSYKFAINFVTPEYYLDAARVGGTDVERIADTTLAAAPGATTYTGAASHDAANSRLVLPGGAADKIQIALPAGNIGRVIRVSGNASGNNGDSRISVGNAGNVAADFQFYYDGNFSFDVRVTDTNPLLTIHRIVANVGGNYYINNLSILDLGGPWSIPGYKFTRSGAVKLENDGSSFAYGPELVTNGTFDTLAGWTASGSATMSLVDGKIRVTAGAVAGGFASLPVPIVQGKSYRFRATMSASNPPYMRVQVAGGGWNHANASGVTHPDGIVDVIFTAGATFSPDIIVMPSSFGAHGLEGMYADFDNISLQEATPDAFDTFATNVPGIVPNKGFYARGALTNYVIQSQTMTAAAWLLFNATVTADVATAPDATVTMDGIVEAATNNGHCIYQNVGGMPAGIKTYSCFVKAGTRNFASLRGTNSAGAYSWATINLTTGAVQVNAAAGIIGGYGVDYGNGIWRIVLVHNSADLTADLVIAASDVATAPGIALSTGNPYLGAIGAPAIHAWGYQALAGNHPDGGPVIPTGAAILSTGEDALEFGQITADEDFLLWIVADGGTPIQDDHRGILALSRADYSSHYQIMKMGNAGNTTFTVLKDNAGLASAILPVANAAGRYALAFRRKAGKTGLVAAFNGVAGVSPETTEALITALARISVGSLNNGITPANGVIRGLYKKVGTFSDAQAQALLLSEIA